MIVLEKVSSRKREQDKEYLTISNKGERIIRLPITEPEYLDLISDRKTFMKKLSVYADLYAELFPEDWKSIDYGFHEYRTSKKLGLRHGIIRHKKDRSILYDIQPNYVMPYMSGLAQDVSFGLLLILFGVPFWLVAYGLGRDSMYWYRLFRHLGRFNLVGTTLIDPTKMPKDLVVDEKISYWAAQEVYACMTVGGDCILGMGLSQEESESALSRAYGKFKTAIQRLIPDYQPISINSDGWAATKKALKNLFPKATIVLCFLHSVIKIRQVAQKEPKKQELFDKVWAIYHSPDANSFDDAVLHLDNWAKENVVKDSVKERIAKIGKRKEEFKTFFDAPTAKRTTNMVDRLMKPVDRFLFMKQYFHGNFKSAELMLNALALCINFAPFAPRTKCKNKDNFWLSRSHALNNKIFDENWLRNLLSAASCNGLRVSTK
jgi:Transposase, Mutator family